MFSCSMFRFILLPPERHPYSDKFLVSTTRRALFASTLYISLHSSSTRPDLPARVNGPSSFLPGPRQLCALLANFNKALDLNPKSGYTYEGHGLLYNKEGNFTLALPISTRLRKAGNAPGAYLGRGNAYALQGDKDRARAALSKAIELSINDIAAREEAQKELDKLNQK